MTNFSVHCVCSVPQNKVVSLDLDLIDAVLITIFWRHVGLTVHCTLGYITFAVSVLLRDTEKLKMEWLVAYYSGSHSTVRTGVRVQCRFEPILYLCVAET